MLVAGFAALVIVAGTASLLFARGQKIEVTLKIPSAVVNQNISIQIPSEGDGINLTQENLTATDAITPSASTKVDDFATGTITLYNTNPTEQALANATRLESESGGVIVRIQSKVIIPARGQVDVNVKADQAGVSGNVAPGDWLVPGLKSAKSKVVYGRNETALTGGQKEEGEISDADINTAKTKITTQLTATETQPGRVTFVWTTGEDAQQNGNMLTVSLEKHMLSITEDKLQDLMKEKDSGNVTFPTPVVILNERPAQQSGKYTIPVPVSITTIPKLDSKILAQQIAGKKIEEVRSLIVQQFGTEAALTISNTTLTTFPEAGKLHVNIIEK